MKKIPSLSSNSARLFTLLTALSLACHSRLASASQSTPTTATRDANENVTATLPADTEDEEFARRGFMGTRADPLIRKADGKVVWNLNAYNWVQGAAPASVNPSLWRHAKLLALHGLFRVSDRIYQVRSFDGSNMTVVVGATGFIILDTLTTEETAQAALELVRQHLGDKPVVAVVYSHSHVDHFGGIRGAINQTDVAAGRVHIYAPEGFVEHAIGENIIAGPAMGRRAAYQIGTALDAGPLGTVTSGIGLGMPAGTITFIAPTDYITPVSTERVIDGVRFQFQLTPGTEAPAEMNAYLPEHRALWLAENANATMHNILTPRGALVRDAKAWADYLTASLKLFGPTTDVMFTSHAWPRFGNERVSDFIASHRDAYKYLHDQSVRLMNKGFTGAEIAERIQLPPELAGRWFNRGYYGTMIFNSRAIYQRYMGWYDGNPVNLHALPEEQSASKYVAAMGGGAKVLRDARHAFTRADYRWAAELLNHLVFADPHNEAARSLLAEVEEQLGYQSESAIWRNMYLSAARELRGASLAASIVNASNDFIGNTPTSMIFDLLAVRVNPDRAETQQLTLEFPERAERFCVSIHNGVLLYEQNCTVGQVQSTIVLPRRTFIAAMLAPASTIDNTQLKGELATLERFRRCFDEPPDAAFAIVTP
jgi:alkyl sulfatase BDS1-like metallo-beta-lactamase superfamily hydrolase